jgi:CubicO group peptidase (beta-lactamase class C family)
MTKPISATAVMLCRDAGLLSLDDPISKFIPEFAKTETGGTAGFTPITVGHLLSHTSGLGGAQRVHDSLASTAAEIAGRPRLFEPGSRWRYSPGINVAARIVEIVSGQVFAAFLQQRIFDPLEMRDTSFHPSPAQLARLAVLYRPVKGSSQWLPATSWISQLDPHQPPNPSASLFSTAGDLARFYRMFLAGGVVNGHRFLSTASLQEMTRTHTSGLIAGFSPGNAWGLGWELILQPQGVNAVLSPGTYGHFGAFGTQGWIDPQRRIFFVLLVQRVGFGDDVANSVLRERFQHAVMGPLRR